MHGFQAGDKITVYRHHPLKWWQKILRWATRGKLYPKGWPITEAVVNSIEEETSIDTQYRPPEVVDAWKRGEPYENESRRG